MIWPSGPTLTAKDVANRLEYPRFSISGIMILPMVAVVAGAEPDRHAKNMDDSTDTIPIPPVTCRTRRSATCMRRAESPPEDIKSPAKIKPGIANNGNDCVPAITRCASTIKSISNIHNTTTEVIPMAKAIGTPNTKRKRNPRVNTHDAALTALYFLTRLNQGSERMQANQGPAHRCGVI